MATRNGAILPQYASNRGEPASGARRGASFDEATNQKAIMAMVLRRMGQWARFSRPGGLDAYPAVMPNVGGQRVPQGSQVTSGKSMRDPAAYGASGGRTGKADGQAVGLSPSFVLNSNGVPNTWTPTDTDMVSRGGRRRVRSAVAGRRETHQAY